MVKREGAWGSKVGARVYRLDYRGNGETSTVPHACAGEHPGTSSLAVRDGSDA